MYNLGVFCHISGYSIKWCQKCANISQAIQEYNALVFALKAVKGGDDDPSISHTRVLLLPIAKDLREISEEIAKVSERLNAYEQFLLMLDSVEMATGGTTAGFSASGRTMGAVGVQTRARGIVDSYGFSHTEDLVSLMNATPSAVRHVWNLCASQFHIASADYLGTSNYSLGSLVRTAVLLPYYQLGICYKQFENTTRSLHQRLALVVSLVLCIILLRQLNGKPFLTKMLYCYFEGNPLFFSLIATVAVLLVIEICGIISLYLKPMSLLHIMGSSNTLCSITC